MPAPTSSEITCPLRAYLRDDDLDVFRAGLGPAQAHPPLIVDPDRVLSLPAAFEIRQLSLATRTRPDGQDFLAYLVSRRS